VVLYNLLEGLRVIAGLIYPVMPQTAATMHKHLGLNPEEPFFRMHTIKAWKNLPPGTQLPKSITLFPRVELKAAENAAEGADDGAEGGPPLKPQISIEQFAALDLRVATVVRAEALPRAKKLLKLEVDLGEKEPRTLVAGIAGSYSPDTLEGKQVIVVANLKPAKLMGVLSQGMLLAASTDNETVVLSVERPMKPGTPIR